MYASCTTKPTKRHQPGEIVKQSTVHGRACAHIRIVYVPISERGPFVGNRNETGNRGSLAFHVMKPRNIALVRARTLSCSCSQDDSREQQLVVDTP